MVTIEIDKDSGFCFGVVNAIRKAEKELKKNPNLFCLGDIVHNTNEVYRLEERGMVTIDYEKLTRLQEGRVLFRAHGEPPSVYELAQREGLKIIDATCPVVLQVQRNILQSYEQHRDEKWQIVIFGQRGHAEVNGLVGQTGGNAIVIESPEEADLLDYSNPIELFSQTTKPLDTFHKLIALIRERMQPDTPFIFHDTICRQVAMRIPNIGKFACKHDIIFFIAGRKSSNGKVLFAECQRVNPHSYFVSDVNELTRKMLPSNPNANVSIGICGATSTPRSQMESLVERIKTLLGEDFLLETN